MMKVPSSMEGVAVAVTALAGGAALGAFLASRYYSRAAPAVLPAVGGGRSRSSPPLPGGHQPPLPDFVEAAIHSSSSSSSSSSTDEGWRLFYWPGMPGRGEFMRLLFEATGTPYEDVFAEKTWREVAPLNYAPGKPFFAFPAIAHGDFFLSQTPVIIRYMAKRLNGGELYPRHERDRYQAEVLLAGVVDLVAEGHDAWHAIDKNGGYLQQKEETEPFVQYYKTKRLPKWLTFFEAALQRNYDGRAFFIGQELSYVDLCVFHVLDGIAFQCPEEWAAAQVPLLKVFHERIANLPAIARYLKSDRRFPFSGTGPIF